MNTNIYIDVLKRIANHSAYGSKFKFVGNTALVAFENGNRAKIFCNSNNHGNCTEIAVAIINKIDGVVDRAYLPFKNYFSAVQCSKNAPLWYPHIDGGKWYFSETYNHVLPKEQDYARLADGIDGYISLFE